jgi:hypothetical protein
LNSGGNFLGIGTSFPPGHAGRKRCQPKLQQTHLMTEAQVSDLGFRV